MEKLRKNLKKFLMFCFWFLGTGGEQALAQVELRLPFPGGESWVVTRGYNTKPTHVGSDQYALDFTLNGCDAYGRPALAAAAGTVEIDSENDDSAYGINLYVNHDGGHRTRYAHLSSISVANGQYVMQGEEIGRVGNTGNVTGDACNDYRRGAHLHFVYYYNNTPTKPEPMSDYTGFTGNSGPYTSNNYFTRYTYFSFPDHSSEGWTYGQNTQAVSQTQSDLNTWMAAAQGSNPGLVSPSLTQGLNTDQFRKLRFSARVDGSGSMSSGYVWLKDETGNWDHSLYFGQVPRDYEFQNRRKPGSGLDI